MTYTKTELRVLRELTPGYLALVKNNPGGVKGYIDRTYLVWFDWFPPKREEWMDDDEYGWKKDRQKKVTEFSFSSSPVKCLILLVVFPYGIAVECMELWQKGLMF